MMKLCVIIIYYIYYINWKLEFILLKILKLQKNNIL